MANPASSTDPISPAPAFGSGRKELPAYLSNALVGLRVREVPFEGIAILSGYSDEHPVEGIEAAARVPYPLAGKLRVNGVRLSDAGSEISGLEQRYDFATGELTSCFRFSAEGVCLSATVLTFCSRSHPTLTCQRIEVTCDKACELMISAGIDTRAIEGHGGRVRKDVDGADGLIRWTSCGEIATCGLAYTSAFDGDDDAKRSLAERGDQLTTHYAVRAQAGRRYRFAQLTSVVAGVMHSQPEFQAARAVALGRRNGFDRFVPRMPPAGRTSGAGASGWSARTGAGRSSPTPPSSILTLPCTWPRRRRRRSSDWRAGTTTTATTAT
jgi:hypothetical protein